MKITTYDNGDLGIQGFMPVTPSGVMGRVLVHAASGQTIVHMVQRLETGEPWVCYVLNELWQGPFITATGTVECDDDGNFTYGGLEAFLTANAWSNETWAAYEAAQ